MVESCMSDRKLPGCKFESPSRFIKPGIVESGTNLIQPTKGLKGSSSNKIEGFMTKSCAIAPSNSLLKTLIAVTKPCRTAIAVRQISLIKR